MVGITKSSFNWDCCTDLVPETPCSDRRQVARPGRLLVNGEKKFFHRSLTSELLPCSPTLKVPGPGTAQFRLAARGLNRPPQIREASRLRKFARQAICQDERLLSQSSEQDPRRLPWSFRPASLSSCVSTAQTTRQRARQTQKERRNSLAEDRAVLAQCQKNPLELGRGVWLLLVPADEVGTSD
ncbi:hypothetical protein VTI74DRAFT_1587 [Chaetomium olivicolor]